jgi:hypothetical protein
LLKRSSEGEGFRTGRVAERVFYAAEDAAATTYYGGKDEPWLAMGQAKREGKDTSEGRLRDVMRAPFVRPLRQPPLLERPRWSLTFDRRGHGPRRRGGMRRGEGRRG